jgi:hypothetical protein
MGGRWQVKRCGVSEEIIALLDDKKTPTTPAGQLRKWGLDYSVKRKYRKPPVCLQRSPPASSHKRWELPKANKTVINPIVSVRILQNHPIYFPKPHPPSSIIPSLLSSPPTPSPFTISTPSTPPTSLLITLREHIVFTITLLFLIHSLRILPMTSSTTTGCTR